VQWVIAVIIITVVLVGIMYLLRDESADAHSGMTLLVVAPPLPGGG
jgi:hypothetical protein